MALMALGTPGRSFQMGSHPDEGIETARETFAIDSLDCYGFR